MKTFLSLLAALCFHAGFAVAQELVSQEVTEIKIDASRQLTTIEGWGSSLCWWAGQVGLWEEEKLDSLITLVVAPDGLNMNVFRYNIGGGDDPSHADGHMVRGKGKRAEMEGFLDEPGGEYHWERDEAQRRIMLKIKELRPDAIFEAFSNSPPYWMTYSGCAGGAADPNDDNLRPEYYEAFCDYLVTVVKHYKEEYGIEFKTLEPFNEPLSDFWFDQGTQEGCHFEAATQVAIIRLLYPRLIDAGLSTGISASDESYLSQTLEAQKVYRAADVWRKLLQINTHSYRGTDAERQRVRDVAQEAGCTLWQSETGPQGRIRGLEANLSVAQKLFDDMRIMRPTAWLDWQVLEEHGFEWSCINSDLRTHEFYIRKNYYVRQQVTRFMRQGYHILHTSDSHVLAAVSPDESEVVVAVLNAKGTDRPMALMLSRLPLAQEVKAFRTGKTENCEEITRGFHLASREITYTAPPMSLTTFVVRLQGK